ncbi:MAG: oligosaccharide flippase family protein [bacterium]
MTAKKEPFVPEKLNRLSHRFTRLNNVLRGKSLRARVMTGGAVLLLGEVFSNGVRLISNLLMTRMLYPEAFGIMLVVNVVFSALSMLSDVGIRSAIISRKGELDQQFINVAWTIMIIRGFVLGAIAVVLAQPLADWYGHPELFGLVLLVSFGPIIGGFTSPFPRVAERQVELVRVTLWQVSAQTGAIGITLIWLYFYPSIWALAANGLFSAVISAVLSFTMFPLGKVRLEWDHKLAKELFHFGKWILLGTSLTFLGRQGDSLIVSRFIDFEVLGVFSIAISLAKLIEMLAEKLSWGLLFPVYSEMTNGEIGESNRKTLKLRLSIYAVCFPIVVLLSLLGRDLITLLYDPRYIEAGWMLEVMSLGLGFYVLAATVNSLPLAHQHSKLHMIVQLLRVVSVLGCMLIGGIYFGLIGLVWGVAIGQVAYYPLLQIVTRRYNSSSVLLDLVFGLGSIALAALVWNVRGWPVPSTL